MVSSIAPIRRCRDLTAVSRLVARDRGHTDAMKALRATENHEEHLVLCAPANVALAIDHMGAQWPTDRPLRVLLVAPHWLACLDEGQWYRFVPAMLCARGEISVTFSELDRAEIRISRARGVLSRQKPIRTYFERPVRDLLRRPPCEFDLAVGFSDFAAGDPLLADLVAMKEHAIPFYFTSFSSTHALLRHAVLRAHGAEAEAVVGESPFSLVSVREGENWNRVLSRVPVENLPDPGTALDEDYLKVLEITATMVTNSHRRGDASQAFWPVGTPIEGRWVHTLDGIAVNPQSGAIYDACEQKLLGTLGGHWLEHLPEPDPSWDEVDRLVWAANARYLAVVDGIAPLDHRERVAQ